MAKAGSLLMTLFIAAKITILLDIKTESKMMSKLSPMMQLVPVLLKVKRTLRLGQEVLEAITLECLLLQPSIHLMKLVLT